MDPARRELGEELGRSWASTRADSKELSQLLRLVACYGGPTSLLTSLPHENAEALASLFVFLATPPHPDAVPAYREVWQRMIGQRVDNPWRKEFVEGFIAAAMETARQRVLSQTSEADEPTAETDSRSSPED